MSQEPPSEPSTPLTQITEGAAFTEIVALAHRALNFTLFHVGGQDINIVTVLVVGCLIVGTWWISAVVQRTVERAFRARGVTDRGTTAVTTRLLHYAIMAVGLGLAIQQVGINLSALFAAGALFAVGLGFAMQNIAQNFVSGLILLVERAIKPGDVVEVEGRVVRILNMGIRTTVGRTRDDEELIIPNASLVQSAVKNFTLGDPTYRVRVNVGVSYESDMRAVRAALEGVAADTEWALKERAPVVLLTDFGDSSVDWQVSVWCEDAWVAPRMASDLRERVWWGLKEVGVEIAFPQLDVHFDPPIEKALGHLPRSA